jgi:hypothetical protein
MYIQIGAVIFPPADILLRQRILTLLDQAAASETGHAGALEYFFGPPTHGWVFGNDNAFYRIALAVAALPAEQRAPEQLPNTVAPSRKPASVAVPGGTVTIAGQRYTSALALANSPVIAGLAAAAAVIRLPAVLALASNMLNAFSFASWAVAATAIGGWNGTGALPVAVSAARVPVRPVSALARYDPTVEADRPHIVDHARRFSYAWSTCGQTGQHLTARLHDLGGDIQRENEITFNHNEGDQLTAFLVADVAVRTVIEIYNMRQHHFVIEKRPADQLAIMQQGFISGYTSTWWAGLTPALETFTTQASRVTMTGRRAVWGLAQPVDLGALGALLGAFLAEPRLNTPGALVAWDALPFLPGLREWSQNVPPAWEVKVWSVNAPDTARIAIADRLGAQQTSPWLTQAVLQEATEYWTRISAVQEQIRQEQAALQQGLPTT